MYVCVGSIVVLLFPSLAQAQTSQVPQPRRQFVTVSLDWLDTQPLHFAEHPLEDLLGTEVGSAQQQDYDYETRDGATRITVEEFKRRSQGGGVTVFPLGLRTGTTLGIRGSFEGLPDIRVTFEGAAPFSSYVLTNAGAYDVGAGIFVSDRSAGWGLGSRAFAVGGIGRISSDLGDGRRYFGRRRRRPDVRSAGDRVVREVCLEQTARPRRTSILHRSDQHSRHGEFLGPCIGSLVRVFPDW